MTTGEDIGRRFRAAAIAAAAAALVAAGLWAVPTREVRADPPAPVSGAQLRARESKLRERYGLPFHKWVHTLQQANPPDTQVLMR